MTELQNNQLPPQPEEEDEINLIQLAKMLWKSRRLVIKITVIFMVLGLLVAFLTPSEYSVTTVMVPQVAGAKSKLGGLSSLAAMAGINIDMSSSSEISPLVYPQIVQSIPFKKELIKTKLTFEGIDHPVTYYDYYMNYYNPGVIGTILNYTVGFAGKIKDALFPNKMSRFKSEADSSGLIWLTKDQEKLAKHLDNTVYVNVDQKTGNVSLTAIMSEPLAAAQLGKRAQELLQQFIIDYKIKKVKAQLEFIKGRYEYRKKVFEQAQEKLARFLDRNRNVSTAMAQAQEARLQNQYQLAFNVYSNLAQQLEQAKIQVKQETPVFSVIQPVTVPNLRYKPKRVLILIMWTFVGVLVGIGWVFGKEYLEKVKAEWEEKE